MAPFQPRNDQSYKIMIVELAQTAQPGDVFTYDVIANKLNLDAVSDRPLIRQAIAAARPLLLRDHLRALVAVRGVGYRVAKANEHAGIAQTHRRKADGQIHRALEVLRHTDEAALTPAELQRHRAVTVAVNILHSRMTSAEARLHALESAVFGDGPTIVQGSVDKTQ